jgi:indole-3-glycerol phosphate synthase
MLSDLTAGALADSAARREFVTYAEVEAVALAQLPALDALQFLAPAEHIKVIAEVNASPSRGDRQQSRSCCLRVHMRIQSVSRTQIQGTFEEVLYAEVSVPVLRKDFIAEKYQILEARAAGAICSLIVARTRTSLSSTSLPCHWADRSVETHSREELHVLDIKLIGVNAQT